MGCRKRYSSKHLDCHCHHKQSCNCKKEVHCNLKDHLLKDCMRTDWTVPEGNVQTIYQTCGLRQIFGSGYISYDEGDAPFIIVRFYLNGDQQGSDIQVFEDSSVAFNYTRFNRVTIMCPGVDVGTDAECHGELSITTRFPVY